MKARPLNIPVCFTIKVAFIWIMHLSWCDSGCRVCSITTGLSTMSWRPSASHGSGDWSWCYLRTICVARFIGEQNAVLVCRSLSVLGFLFLERCGPLTCKILCHFKLAKWKDLKTPESLFISYADHLKPIYLFCLCLCTMGVVCGSPSCWWLVYKQVWRELQMKLTEQYWDIVWTWDTKQEMLAVFLDFIGGLESHLSGCF